VNNRLTDASAIEQRLLELAHTTDAKLTAATLAYFAPCSIEAAQRVLEALASRDQLSMEIEDDGTIVYELRGRQKLSASPRPTALVPIARPIAPVASPTLAAVLSLFMPGAGHLYAGRIVSAVLWFLVVSAGYVLVLPGLILHLFSMVSAAGAATRRNLAANQRFLHAGAV
jgi:hypothetical protein